MAKFITQKQYEEMEDAAFCGVEETHDLLEKYAGIKASPYTAYLYYDEYGNFLASSDEPDIDDLLEKACVEVRHGG